MLLNEKLPTVEADIENKLKLKDYSVVILTETDDNTAIAIDNYCRKNNVKFICTNLYGPFARIFNDFGANFPVLDKNGEESVECMISSISNEENAVVKLLAGAKHPYQDGDTIQIYGVEGMEEIASEKEVQIEKDKASDKKASIN